VAVVVNAAARNGLDGLAIERAVAVLRGSCHVDLVPPAGVEEMESTVRALSITHDVIVAAGGDGTVHRVLNGVAHSKAAMGVVPLGTGNDFARAFGIPATAEAAARLVIDGMVRPIDLVGVNGRLFGTVGVLGVPADSALAVARLTSSRSIGGAMTRLLGEWSYRAVGLAQLLAPGSLTERLRLAMGEDELPQTADELYGVFVANTAMLGGGLRLPLDVDVRDGQLEVCRIPRMSRLRLLWAFICFAQGWRVPDGALQVSRSAQTRILCDRALPFAADGELVCTDVRFDLVVHPLALRLIC
jgi:diacylglycerol kinase (ATP)